MRNKLLGVLHYGIAEGILVACPGNPSRRPDLPRLSPGVIYAGLQDFWQRQPDRGTFRGFDLLDHRGLPEVDGDYGVALDEPRPFAAGAFTHQDVGDIDPRRNQVGQFFQSFDAWPLALDNDRLWRW